MRALGRYSQAATPWALLSAAAAITTGLLLLVARWPAAVWPLHGAAIGLLAGTSAWAVDERCAAIVDVAPRPLWWRTLARMPTLLLLLTIWTAIHVAVRNRLPDHLVVLLVQGASAAFAGFAAATWQRSRGGAEPGQWIASFTCPLVVGVALARPGNEYVPLFPVWPHENWARSTTIWILTGGLAVVLFVSALWTDARDRNRPRGAVALLRGPSRP